MPDNIFVFPMVLAAGSSGGGLSEAVNLAGKSLLRINMPAAWTTASLTFQLSEDASTYNNLYNASGEYTLTSGSPGRAVALPEAEFRSLRWLKLRSGTSGSPVSQAADRTINLVVRDI